MPEATTETTATTVAKGWRENAKEELEMMSQEFDRLFENEKALIEQERGEGKGTYAPPTWYYWALVALYTLAQAVLGLFVSLPLTEVVVSFGIPVNIGITLLLLQVLHFVGSIRSIKVEDLAGFTLFGRPWYAPKTGFHIAPLGILQLIRASRNYRDKRFPGSADKIFRVSRKVQEQREGGDMPPEGKIRPIFMLTGEPRLTEDDRKALQESGGGNPLDRQFTVEVSFFVRYRPDQDYGGIFRIARNLSANVGDLDKPIEDLIGEQSEREMRSVLSRHTALTINENRDLINEVFTKRFRLTVMRLGIDIDKRGCGLEDLNLSHETSEAQANAVRALFNKSTAITNAAATRKTLEEEGAGRASAEYAVLKARADGGKLLKEGLGVKGDSVLASEAILGILGKTNVILAGAEGGVKDLLGLVKGAQAVLEGGPTEPEAQVRPATETKEGA